MTANKRILIIDDEEDIRFLLRRFLVANHYEVAEAENLKQGFEMDAKNEPSIIILDVNLPDGNGIHYARQFKKEGRMLIFISADNDQLTMDYKKYGADAFLRKPFNANELLTTIGRQHCA